MPATISRLLMCFGVLIAAAIVYFVSYIAFERPLSDETALIVAGTMSCTLFAGGWALIWVKVVRWTPQRVSWTVGVTIMGLAFAVLCFLLMQFIVRYSAEELGIFVGSLCWATTWVIGTSIIWQENAHERGERLRRLGIHAVACPDCGYNLTGLKEARCPECGAAYTLDQLYASIAEQRSELGGD